MRHRADCRKGIHTFSRRGGVGGGIQRQVCQSCGLVEIRLQSEAEVEDSKLFAPARADSLFAIQVALESAFEPPEPRFGVKPERRAASSIER